jgi:hypothetical protein
LKGFTPIADPFYTMGIGGNQQENHCEENLLEKQIASASVFD